MSDADQQAGAAGRTGLLDSEGRLNPAGGRAATNEARPPSPPVRLKRSIDLFTTTDGTVYLLRSEGHDEFVIPDATPSDRLLLTELARQPRTAGELRQALDLRGLPSDGLARTLADLEGRGIVERVAEHRELTPEEEQRYDRQLIYLADLAPAGVPAERLQRRLADSTVALLGCGGLGSWTACGLACAGIGCLVLVDDDSVELSNLNRQLLFTEADLGRPKVEAAAQALRQHNATLDVSAVRERIGAADDLTEILESADLLIATADWPPHELPRWVNQACLRARVPFITAGQFLPIVRVGPLVIPGRSACLECLERTTRREFPLYDELADHRTAHPIPAATIGAASGVIGSILAMEAIHLLTGVITPASAGRAWMLDIRTLSLRSEIVMRDPECSHCAGLENPGHRWPPSKPDRPLAV